MTIKTTKQIEQEVEIPCFYKDPRWEDYVAVLDAKTAVKVFSLNQRVCVTHDSPENLSSDVSNAVNNWTPVSELEFMSVHRDALDSMSLDPKLCVGNIYDKEIESVRLNGF